jgi:glycosyltransferase involved in cell wall biosynthesis
MPRVLFVAAHRPDRSPSQRFRFEQYLNFLRQNGFECDFSWLVSSEDDSFLYKHGNYFRKFSFLNRSYQIRKKDVKIASSYDIIFVQREALMFRSTRFEKAFSRKSKLIFDFDDAIWLMDVSDGNRNWRWLKDPSKTSHIIEMSHMIFAGNRYLAEYARQFNDNVKIIPTTIDTDYHKKKKAVTDKNKICIGWAGSTTTIKHFRMAENFLGKLKEKYGDKIYLKLIGDATYENPQLGLTGTAWNLATEIEDLSEFDIGIMPLPDDEWAKGKCGFKGLQYMAMEIPAVMSPVGVNTEIVEDGVNGFLATTDDEWIEKISLLIDSDELRKKFGAEGRKTVIDQYSVESQKERYLEFFNEVVSSKLQVISSK